MRTILLMGLALLVACAPSSTPPASVGPVSNAVAARLIGTWQGKDTSNGSTITLTIAAGSGSRLKLSATDDATQGWCGVVATGSAVSELNASNELPVDALWACADISKASQTFSTVITCVAASDTINAYGSAHTRFEVKGDRGGCAAF